MSAISDSYNLQSVQTIQVINARDEEGKTLALQYKVTGFDVADNSFIPNFQLGGYSISSLSVIPVSFNPKLGVSPYTLFDILIDILGNNCIGYNNHGDVVKGLKRLKGMYQTRSTDLGEPEDTSSYIIPFGSYDLGVRSHFDNYYIPNITYCDKDATSFSLESVLTYNQLNWFHLVKWEDLSLAKDIPDEFPMGPPHNYNSNPLELLETLLGHYDPTDPSTELTRSLLVAAKASIQKEQL